MYSIVVVVPPTYLWPVIVEHAHHAHGHQFGTRPPEGSPTQGEDERRLLVVTQLQNVVQGVV